MRKSVYAAILLALATTTAMAQAPQNPPRPTTPSRSRPSARTPAQFLRRAVGSPAIMLMALAGGIAGPWSAGTAAPAAPRTVLCPSATNL